MYICVCDMVYNSKTFVTWFVKSSFIYIQLLHMHSHYGNCMYTKHFERVLTQSRSQIRSQMFWSKCSVIVNQVTYIFVNKVYLVMIICGYLTLHITDVYKNIWQYILNIQVCTFYNQSKQELYGIIIWADSLTVWILNVQYSHIYVYTVY